jgi:hypothetical protein
MLCSADLLGRVYRVASLKRQHSEFLSRGGLYTRLIRRQMAAAQQRVRAAGD